MISMFSLSAALNMNIVVGTHVVVVVLSSSGLGLLLVDRLNNAIVTMRSLNFVVMSILPAFAVVIVIVIVEAVCVCGKWEDILILLLLPTSFYLPED